MVHRLLHLPNELLSCISEYLELESDINAFAQTNRRLYRLLNSYLYRRNIQHSESSALIWAAQNGQKETALKLLEEYTDNEAMIKCCVIPLGKAAKEGHEEVVRLLLDKGANVDAEMYPNSYGPKEGTALQEASRAGHQKVVEMLIDRGADVNTQTSIEGYMNNDALHSASEGGHLEILKLLLKNGAAINSRCGYHGNALQAAIQEGHEEIAKLLIDIGFDVNAEGKFYVSDEDYKWDSSTALYAASQGGYTELVKLLLEHGSNIKVSGGPYGSPLPAAAAMGHEEIVLMLLNHKDVNVNERNEYFSRNFRYETGSALYLASENGHTEVVKLLLDRGADVNARVSGWTTALTAASVGGHEEIVEMLLERGAEVNVENEFCSCTLEAAASFGHIEIAELLIEAGADYQEALEAAQERGDEGENAVDTLLEVSPALLKALTKSSQS